MTKPTSAHLLGACHFDKLTAIILKVLYNSIIFCPSFNVNQVHFKAETVIEGVLLGQLLLTVDVL